MTSLASGAVRHAVLFGDELVVETAREELTPLAISRRREIPAPNLAWVSEEERMRLLDEVIGARGEFRAWLSAEMQALDRLPAEIGLARAQAGKKGTAPKRQRRSSAELREQVVGLRERGLVLAAIADTLNISDRRVRQLLRDSQNSRNGAQERLVHAEKYAA